MPLKAKEPSAAKKTALETMQRGIRRSHGYISNRLRTNKVYRELRALGSPESRYVLRQLPSRVLSERQTTVHKRLIEPYLGSSSDAQRRVFAKVWDETERKILSGAKGGPNKIVHCAVDKLLKQIEVGALQQEPNNEQPSSCPTLVQDAATNNSTSISGNNMPGEHLSTSALSISNSASSTVQILVGF